MSRRPPVLLAPAFVGLFVLLSAPALGLSGSDSPAVVDEPAAPADPTATHDGTVSNLLDLEIGPDGTVFLLASQRSEDPRFDGTRRVHLWVSHPHQEGFERVSPVDPEAGVRFSPTDPLVAMDVSSTGDAFLIQRTDQGFTVLRSADRGDSWSSRKTGLSTEGEEREDLRLVAENGDLGFAYYRDVAGEDGSGDRTGHVWVYHLPERGLEPRPVSSGAERDVHPGPIDLSMTPDGGLVLVASDSEGQITAHTFTVATTDERSSPEHATARNLTRSPMVDAIGPPSVDASTGSVVLAWSERTGGEVRVYVAEALDGSSAWRLWLVDRFASACLSAPELAAGEEQIVVAYGTQPCEPTGRPRAVEVATGERSRIGEPAPARPTTELDALPCRIPATCPEAPPSNRVGLALAAGGEPTMAWPSGNWTILTGTIPPPEDAHPRAFDADVPDGESAAEVLWRGDAVEALGLTWIALVAAAIVRRTAPTLLAPLYSRIDDDDVLDNERRQAIHDLVSEHPGIHFSEVRRRLDISPGNLDHHLAKLVDAGAIRERRLGGYRCLFVPGEVDPAVEKALGAVRTDTAREILRVLSRGSGAGLRQLAERIDRAPSTVSHHLSRLEEAGVIEDRGSSRGLSLTRLGNRVLEVLSGRV